MAHIAGSVGQFTGNAGQLTAQWGVGSMAVVKTALTAAALGVTAYSRVLGRKVSERTDVPPASSTEPAPATPDDVAAAQRQLAVLQWVVPGLKGALVVVGSFADEQQRATEVKKGIGQRVLG